MCELSQKIEVRGSWSTKLVLVMELSTLLFSFLTSQKKFVKDLALYIAKGYISIQTMKNHWLKCLVWQQSLCVFFPH
jgi:hypothetical protein